jgi:hypothetical protein
MDGPNDERNKTAFSSRRKVANGVEPLTAARRPFQACGTGALPPKTRDLQASTAE